MNDEKETLLKNYPDICPELENSKILMSPEVPENLEDKYSGGPKKSLKSRTRQDYEKKCCIMFLKCCCKISFLKNINVKHGVLALFIITLVTIFYYTHYVDNGVFVR